MFAGGWEWIVILVVVLLVFGVGRIARIGGELGQGVKEFRKGIREGTEDAADVIEGETTES